MSNYGGFCSSLVQDNALQFLSYYAIILRNFFVLLSMLVKFLKYLIHHILYNQVQTYPLIYKQNRRDFIFYLFIYLVLLFTYNVPIVTDETM